MKKAIKKAVLGAVGEVLGPQPSLAIVRFWQGVVEVVLRVAIMVAAASILVSGGVAIWQLTGATQSQGGSPDNKGAWSSASGTAAAVCLVGVASIAAVTEASATLFRFINIGYCNLKIRTLLVVDITVGALLTLGGAASSITTTTLATVAIGNSGGGSEGPTQVSLAVTGALGLFMTVMLASLVVWMALFRVFGWNKKVLDYTMRHM